MSSPRAWLIVNGALRPLDNVAFVTAGSLTATVPHGLPAGAPYDLLVQNPDGSVGLLGGTFTAVDMPVPQITSITPTLMLSTVPTTVHLVGKNFRAPVEVEVYDLSPASRPSPRTTCTSSAATAAAARRRRTRRRRSPRSTSTATSAAGPRATTRCPPG